MFWKSFLRFAFLLPLTLAAFNASAAKLEVPAEDAAYTVDIPDSWKPEELERGVACESEDQSVTVVFEVTPAEKLDGLIDENIDWLVKEQKIEIDQKTKTEAEIDDGAIKWKVLKYDGKNDDFGPATIMLIFGATEGSDKVMMITYWVTKEGEEAHSKALTEMLNSVKPVSE